ncbi:MAG TPA: ribonuclease P protein component [Polyangiaceae bacterium]|nr:ribonuclease P protein component [Polyangiaceae bacterium]
MSASAPTHASPSTFGKERRLARRADFLRVQGSTFRVSTRSFVLLVACRPPARARDALETREEPPARLGLTVGKKVGGAPVRNRVKRVFRECFRLWPAPGLVPPGFDLVVIARGAAAGLDLARARAELEPVARLLTRRCEEARAALARAGAEPHVPRAR